MLDPRCNGEGVKPFLIPNTERMDFLEKDLEEIIYEASPAELQERGVEIQGKSKRQLRIGNYGVSDLIFYHKQYYLHETWQGQKIIPFLNITICELKKKKIGLSAFLQSVRYAKGIKSYLAKFHPGIKFQINIKLIGKEVDDSGAFIFIPDVFDRVESYPDGQLASIEFYTFKYNLNGIEFKEVSNYEFTDNGFKRQYNGTR